MTIVRIGACRALSAPFVLSFASLVVAIAGAACDETDRDLGRDVEPSPADAPPALTAAHEAYLGADYVEMGERLRDVIADPESGELAVDNAFALLERAYEETRGQLPARTTLPASVPVLTFGVLNGATPSGPHRAIYLDMHVAEGRGAHVRGMRVTRLPGDRILDLEGRRGALQITPGPPGLDDVKLELRQPDELPDRGVFAIHVAFDDGPAIDTFVLADDLVARAQPEITSPTVGQVFDAPQPEIAWRPFRSPELRAWEKRSLYVDVSRDEESAWSFYQWEPGDRGSVRVGEAGTTAAALKPGSYWMSVLYAEDRTFGGIHASRVVQVARPFSVVR